MGTYYIGPIFQVMNAWRGFEDKIQDLKRAYSELIVTTLAVCISCQSATNIAPIPANSVDHIFTDPSYSWKVQYGENNFIWEAWLGFDTHWHDEEIIVNEVRNKTEADWAEMMRQVMAECHRVLKPGRWLSLCFHDTSEGTWELIQDIMSEAGFVADQSSSPLFIDTGQKAWKQIVADKVTKRDLVINFRKPKPGEISSKAPAIIGDEDETTFNEKVCAIICDYLAAHPGATKDRIYDDVVSRMVRAGRMEVHNFEELLRQVAEETRDPLRKNLFENEDPNLFGTHEISRWYLRETEEGAEESEQAVEESTANRIEQFLVQEATKELQKSQFQWDDLKSKEVDIKKVLETLQQNGPDRKRPKILREIKDIERQLQELGAKRTEWEAHALHYTQIYEFYLPLQPKPKTTLFELLEDYFFLTDRGNWRPPANESERQEKARLRTQAARRTIQRFCRLLEAGEAIPQGLQPDSVTLAEWIRHCKRSGLYAQGRLLYEKGGLKLDHLPEEVMVDVEEDYQVCMRMLARQVEERQRTRRTREKR